MTPHVRPFAAQVVVGTQVDAPKHSQPNAASHITIELAIPEPNVCTVKFALMVAPLVESKSHAYSSNKGPVGVAVPARQFGTDVVPQRHGVSWSVDAHMDE
jgi:hypothetical protein